MGARVGIGFLIIQWAFMPLRTQWRPARTRLERSISGLAVTPLFMGGLRLQLPDSAAPTGLIATAVSGSEINLSWTAPSGTVTGYNVYRGTTSGGESTTPVAAGLGASYADMNVAAGTTYYYTVAASNSAGTGQALAEASAAVPKPPSAPTGLTAVATSNVEIDLSWTAAAGSVVVIVFFEERRRAENRQPPWHPV